jgi:hypothetical protein
MKRLILNILLFMLAVCLTGCVSITRHKEEHVHSAPSPGHRQHIIIRPTRPHRHNAHRQMARRPDPGERHPLP